jgi:CheY-like chemotaxis protein
VSEAALEANGRRHIMVVNDTQEILDLFREILEGEGYRVSLYSYAFRDLDEIKQDQPDLIILDFIIGGEAFGWQLLQKMKLDRATATIPIIACTAAVNLARELEGHLKEKGVAVVLKPFDIDDLLREVDAAWRRLPSDAGIPGTETAP